MSRGAAFLDRDGTIIGDHHFIRTADMVELLPGAANAVHRLSEAGFPVIVITNQSGIARRYLTIEDYQRVRARTQELLAQLGARIDADYMCPHHPDFTGPCECRKPGTLLFRRAAEDLDIDLAASWYIGDKLRDILPAGELGGRGVLVANADTPEEEIERARREFDVARSLDEAADLVIKSAR